MLQYNIKDYLDRRLHGNIKEVSGGDEITINSLFCADTKFHLSVNSYTGLWICFKTGNKGNFTKLYSILEGISYREADQKLTFDYIKSNLLDPQTKVKVDEVERSVDVLEEIYPYEEISYCNDDKSDAYKQAFKVLFERKLISEISTFYISYSEFYRNKLIIPFFRSGKMFYFQARSLFNERPKYLNCPRRKKSTLLYPYDTSSESVLVCEGPLDAISLKIQGINATAVMGSYVSLQQMIILSQSQKQRLVLAFDSDQAGQSAIKRTDSFRKLLRIPEIYYCFPPSGFKDWNEAHAKNIDLKSHVNSNTKLLTWDYFRELELKNI